MFVDASSSVSGLPIGELVDAIAEESGQIAAAQCRMLAKLAELDAREDAAFAWDCKSAAHWLSGRCGYDMAASWEMVRVARRLRSLPAITEAFGTGQLNYHAVKALAHLRHDLEVGLEAQSPVGDRCTARMFPPKRGPSWRGWAWPTGPTRRPAA